MALWGGRFEKGVDAFTQEFGASLEVDKNMAQQDIRGSRAHARMLAEQGVISKDDQKAIDAGLEDISHQISAGTFAWDVNDEDVHMAVESRLTAAIGAPGARLHTGRSRNDQVATDMRLLAKDLCTHLMEGNLSLRHALVDVAEKNMGVVMPGYTHLQHAQPVLFSHHMLAYSWMFRRDFGACVPLMTTPTPIHSVLRRSQVPRIRSTASARASFSASQRPSPTRSMPFRIATICSTLSMPAR